MRGTELTQGQMDAAENYIMMLRSNRDPVKPAMDQEVKMRWEQIVRLVALYGAIRAKAVECGISPDAPGEVYFTERI